MSHGQTHISMCTYPMYKYIHCIERVVFLFTLHNPCPGGCLSPADSTIKYFLPSLMNVTITMSLSYYFNSQFQDDFHMSYVYVSLKTKFRIFGCFTFFFFLCGVKYMIIVDK